jgi:hypothetical protein
MALMTYSTKRLTEELQRSVALRSTSSKNSGQSASLPQVRFEVSPEAAAYVQKMRTYREQAKSVRVGRY